MANALPLSNKNTRTHLALTERYYMIELKNDVFEDLEQERRTFDELIEEFESVLTGSSDTNSARKDPDKGSLER